MVLFFREVDLSSQSSFTYVSALSGSTQCRLAAAPPHPYADRTPCMTLIWGPATCPATSSFQAGPTCFSSAPCCTEIVPRELQTQRQVCHAANEAKASGSLTCTGSFQSLEPCFVSVSLHSVMDWIVSSQIHTLRL